MGNRTHDFASPNSTQQQGGPLHGLSRNHGLYRRFISAICYGSPNIRRLLHQPLWLSNYYCTAITSVFSPRFVFSKISSCGSGTVSALRLGSSPHWGFFFSRLLFLTLAPRDHVTYCQARGLSGHTSPCGECAFSHLEATSGDWLPARLVFYYSSTLDPGTT